MQRTRTCTSILILALVASMLPWFTSPMNTLPFLPFNHEPGWMVPSSIDGTLPPSSGTWLLTQNTTIINEVVEVNGSIAILAPWTLKLVNATLVFSNVNDGITVNGGNLTVIDSHVLGYDRIEITNAGLGFFDHAFLDGGSKAITCDSSSLHVAYTTIENSTVAIGVYNSDGGIIEHSRFERNTGATIEASHGSNLLIRDNVLIAGGDTYNCVGVNAGSFDGLNVSNNIVQNYHKSVFYQNVSNSVLTNNTFEHAINSPYVDGELQFADGCNTITLENNVLYNLTYDGIEIYESSNFLIRKNRIERVQSGTHIEHAPVSNITIVENVFVHATLRADGVVGLYINHNQFSGGTIRIDGCATVEIKYNKICGDSIWTGGSTGVTLEGNEYTCAPADLLGIILVSVAVVAGIIVIAIIVKRKKTAGVHH